MSDIRERLLAASYSAIPSVLVVRDAIDEIDRLEHELADAKRALSEGSSWIPVGERLPPADSYVLAVEPASRPIHPFIPVVARYTTQAGRHMLATKWIDSAGEYIDVSHWMPLPEAPK